MSELAAPFDAAPEAARPSPPAGGPVPAADGSPLSFSAPNWSRLSAVRPIGRPQVHREGVTLQTDAGPLSVGVYARDIFRIRLGDAVGPFYGLLALPPVTSVDELGDVTVEETENAWTIRARGACLTVRLNPLRIALQRNGKSLIETSTDRHFRRAQRLPGFARDRDGWFAAFGLDSDEPVFGLGEKWGALNRRGQLITSWAEDALGVNAEASYKNCPFAWSPSGWGLFVHTPAKVTHSVGFAPWSHRSYALKVEDNELDLFLFVGDTPADLVERYTALTGRMPVPPLWSLGVWLSQAYYRDAEEVLAAAEKTRAVGMPCDVIVLDGRAWLDTRTRFAFEWDAHRYPEPERITGALHAADFKVCCWEYPLVSVHHPLFHDMAERGWLLKDPETGAAFVFRWDPEPFDDSVLTPLPDSGIVDFTHPAAYAFWRDRHAALFRSGVDVIKTDFGEQVPVEVVAHNGDTGRRLHNVYPVMYNRCVFEATHDHFARQAARSGGPKANQGLVLGRSGWTGSQRYPLQWGGDPQADWEGLAASLRGGLSWGMTGAPCYATDIGGFYGPQPSEELFIRWTQAAVFCSHMRFHGIGPRAPWQLGERVMAMVRPALELRYRLLPYLLGVLRQANWDGAPVMRAMAFAFPDDPAAWGFDNQYLFGPDIFVAPVIREGGEVVYYLPAGRWVDFATGAVVDGGRVQREICPIDRIPVWVREGAALALGPAVPHTKALADADSPVDGLWLAGLPDRAPVTGLSPVGFERLDDRTVRLSDVPARTRVRACGPIVLRRSAATVTVQRVD